MNAIEIFKRNNFIHIKKIIDTKYCEELTTKLKNLVFENKTIKDEQCPLSEAIYGQFDFLLEQLLPTIEKTVDKKLYPTYSYARLYKPGDELKNHKDRESCEYSITLTVGFDGKPWPIYMAKNEDKSDAKAIEMDVGDIVVYRGTENFHWRNKYQEGNWQAQIFLHYVDSDGPYKDFKYDKREKLSHHINKENYEVRIYKSIFSKEACNTIIKTYTSDKFKKNEPSIGSDENNKVDKKVRNVERVLLPTHTDLGARLAAIGLDVNHFIYKFNISYCDQCEFLIYPKEGRYTEHIDTFIDPNKEFCRKITVLAFLNDDFEGGKFYIKNGHEKNYINCSKGDVIAFPSFLMHGVDDVLNGVRYSAVAWMVGPWFK